MREDAPDGTSNVRGTGRVVTQSPSRQNVSSPSTSVDAGLFSDTNSGVDCCATSYPLSARYYRLARPFSGLATNRFAPSAESSARADELKA